MKSPPVGETGASSNVVDLICPPLVGIGLTEILNSVDAKGVIECLKLS